jgi:hypothetical protein
MLAPSASASHRALGPPMHILIGLAVAVALLYFWLIGHWFARVLVFLLLAVGLGLGGAALLASAPGAKTEAAAFGFIFGGCAAWFMKRHPDLLLAITISPARSGTLRPSQPRSR